MKIEVLRQSFILGTSSNEKNEQNYKLQVDEEWISVSK